MYAGKLAARLAEGGIKYKTASTLAYIVAADLEHVLDMWIKESATPQQLQVPNFIIFYNSSVHY